MLRFFQYLMPKEERFFRLFDQHARTLLAGAEALRGLLEGGEAVSTYCREVMRREEEADAITREVLIAVRRTFITPFDRSDITDLITAMDDAIDQMQKTARAITLFEVRSFDPAMTEMGERIVEAAKLVVEAVPLLEKINTNAARLAALTEEITRIEGRADEIHFEGLKSLFQEFGKTDGLAFHIGDSIFHHLEEVVDRFDDVANRINGIVTEHV